MTYDEIIKMDDINKKYSALVDYYINQVSVLDWMYDKEHYQHLVFNDREEYKYDNKYHNLDGPAIKMKNGTEMYYIDGKLMDKEDWIRMLREQKLKRIVKNE